MGKSTTMRLTGLACGALMATALLGGCVAQNGTQATEQQTANRQYMTQVNQAMDDLSGRLDGFADAVARGDVVTMRTQADNAYRALDALSALEAPEDLKKVQAAYVEGCNELEEALDAYIALYTEIENATEDSPFDYATYDERLKEIQDQYDKGLEKLRAGDKEASSLPS